MAYPVILSEMEVQLAESSWHVRRDLDPSLFGPVSYGWTRFHEDPASLTIGTGLLAGSPLPGTRRLIFCGYSPQWEGFYVSAMGGAGYVFHRTGLNYLWLRGKAAAPTVLLIRYQAGEYDIQFIPWNPEPAWEGYRDSNDSLQTGFYGLQQALYDRFQSSYEGDNFRILTIGPGAARTHWGAVGSNHIKNHSLTAIEDWAGRGGLGSVMLQAHNLAGIVYGGDWQDPLLRESKEMDAYFMEHFGDRTINVDLALNSKYRYVPEFETGGTFGVNMHLADDHLFSFNYKSIYAADEARLEQNDHFIRDHYLEQFNRETIQLKLFDHCGEPCAIACKKYRQEYKKDYEPYQALGPNCGIFDQRAAELLNKKVDAYGLDAITTGGMISWLMELFSEGILDPRDYGLAPRTDPFIFESQPEQFDVVSSSMNNAIFAAEILEMMLNSPAGEVFRKGMRFAAMEIDRVKGTRSLHRAVFTPHGQSGYMVPNQYWVPGMFAPMPLMGKYFSYYGKDYLPPFELGKKNVERFIYELYSENNGACRFHRKWVEDIIDEITLSHFDLKIDFWAYNYQLAKEITFEDAGKTVFWESERVVDIIAEFHRKWQREGLADESLKTWVERFDKDRHEAAHAYWEEMRAGMQAAFDDGMREPPHAPHRNLPRRDSSGQGGG